MSLAGLVSGAECAVQVNPLSQVLKHTDGDRSLQQVCLLASGIPRATYHHSFRTPLLVRRRQE
jgi:peroxin-5